jgi:hypothetical protein
MGRAVLLPSAILREAAVPAKVGHIAGRLFDSAQNTLKASVRILSYNGEL